MLPILSLFPNNSFAKFYLSGLIKSLIEVNGFSLVILINTKFVILLILKTICYKIVLNVLLLLKIMEILYFVYLSSFFNVLKYLLVFFSFIF